MLQWPVTNNHAIQLQSVTEYNYRIPIIETILDHGPNSVVASSRHLRNSSPALHRARTACTEVRADLRRRG